jgi:hypothetical protein
MAPTHTFTVDFELCVVSLEAQGVCNLAKDGRDASAAIQAAGFVSALLSTLAAHADDTEVVKTACRAVESLAASNAHALFTELLPPVSKSASESGAKESASAVTNDSANSVDFRTFMRGLKSNSTTLSKETLVVIENVRALMAAFDRKSRSKHGKRRPRKSGHDADAANADDGDDGDDAAASAAAVAAAQRAAAEDRAAHIAASASVRVERSAEFVSRVTVAEPSPSPKVATASSGFAGSAATARTIDAAAASVADSAIVAAHTDVKAEQAAASAAQSTAAAAAPAAESASPAAAPPVSAAAPSAQATPASATATSAESPSDRAADEKPKPSAADSAAAKSNSIESTATAGASAGWFDVAGKYSNNSFF